MIPRNWDAEPDDYLKPTRKKMKRYFTSDEGIFALDGIRFVVRSQVNAHLTIKYKAAEAFIKFRDTDEMNRFYYAIKEEIDKRNK